MESRVLFMDWHPPGNGRCLPRIISSTSGLFALALGMWNHLVFPRLLGTFAPQKWTRDDNPLLQRRPG